MVENSKLPVAWNWTVNRKTANDRATDAELMHASREAIARSKALLDRLRPWTIADLQAPE